MLLHLQHPALLDQGDGTGGSRGQVLGGIVNPLFDFLRRLAEVLFGERARALPRSGPEPATLCYVQHHPMLDVITRDAESPRRRAIGQQKDHFQHHWTRVQGLRLHARLATALAPIGCSAVVMIHGLNVSGRTMVPIAELLAADFRVYVPDLPGCGESEKPACALRIPDLADVLVAWMGALGLERAALVGNSLGCQVAVDCAVRYPERVERLVLIGPTVDPKSRPLLRLLWRWLLDGQREPLARRRTLLRGYLKLRWLPAIQMLRSMIADHIEAKFPRVSAPTLVVRGDRDPIVPQRWAEEVIHLLPAGHLAVIRGAAHTAQFSAPVECARVIRPFLCSAAPSEKGG